MHAYSIHLLILSDVTVRLTTKIYGYALSRISHSVGDFKQKEKKKKKGNLRVSFVCFCLCSSCR